VLVETVTRREGSAPRRGQGDASVRRELERWFAWREHVLRADLAHAPARAAMPLRVGITGASGFLGRELARYLTSQGWSVVRFVRGRAAQAGEIAWDPARAELDPGALDGLHAIVHLSGASIAERPWTADRKRELAESRVGTTALLARVLAGHPSGPRVLVSASAVGWYGDRGEEELDETSAPGSGFLAGLARDWEAAAEPAARAGVRVVHPRFGLVLWPGAGVLGKLELPFRWGAGGPLASGRSWWSWIGLLDLLEMLAMAIQRDTIAGPFNAVAPEPARQRDVARALGRVLARPSWLPAPALALRAVLGRERADELLLASQRVRSGVLPREGFRHRDPSLETLLARLYGRPRREAEAQAEAAFASGSGASLG